MSSDAEPPKRRYRMTVRAAATDATRTRILDAAVEVFWERPLADISLEEVARRAGVSLPTVVRHFGTKESLFAAAGVRETERIRRQRDEAPVGDLRLAVRVLFDHYEDLGDAVLRLLAEADRVPALGAVADRGREVHAQWCERVFAPVLTDLNDARRERRLSEFIVLTDVLVWKLLRRDRRLSRSEAELAMCEFIEPLMGGT